MEKNKNIYDWLSVKIIAVLPLGCELCLHFQAKATIHLGSSSMCPHLTSPLEFPLIVLEAKKTTREFIIKDIKWHLCRSQKVAAEEWPKSEILMMKRYLPKIICALQLLQIYPARDTCSLLVKWWEPCERPKSPMESAHTSLLQDMGIKGAVSGKQKSGGVLYIWKTHLLT